MFPSSGCILLKSKDFSHEVRVLYTVSTPVYSFRINDRAHKSDLRIPTNAKAKICWQWTLTQVV